MAAEAAPLSEAEARALLLPLLDARAADGLVLATSGGPDSTALLRLAAPLAAERGTRVLAAIVDHGLRPGSDAEARTVAAWAAQAGAGARVLAWSGEKPARGVQEAARAARYALLAAAAREAGAGAVATAHHRDDQAETVLMRLAAGSGLSGLAGMRPLSRLDGLVLARPFLDVPKARLVATCRAAGWPFLEDPSNEAARFARARWRRLAPALAAEGLGPERLATLARRLRRADEALEAAARAAFDRARRPGPGPLALSADALLAEPEEVALRALALALAAAGGRAVEPSRRLARLEAFAARLAAAARAGGRFRGNLAGVVVALADGVATLAPEPPRRRGAR